MKQLHYLHPSGWGVGLLLSGILLGCSDEMHLLTPSDGDDGLRFELQASIDQVNETRADESGFANGDRFGLFVVNYSGGNPGTLTLSDNQVNNVAITYNANANTWQAATDIYWSDPITPADVYGYYPFYNGMSDVDAYNFEVKSDQSIVGTEGEMGSYEASDLLWAKTSKAIPGKKVELTFSHIMAGVKVVLQQGSGFEGDAWTKLTKTVTVDNTVRTSEVDLSKGIVTPSGNYDRNIVMNPEGDAWRAVVVPQSVSAGKTIIGITLDGKPYAYSRTDGMKYTAGKLHTFTIKIDRKDDSGDYALTLVNEDIIPWEADKSSHDFESNSYLTVHVAEAGNLKACLEAMGCDVSSLRNLKVTGQLTDEDFRMMREEMHQLASLHIGEARMVNIEYKVNIDSWDSPKEFMDDMIPENALSHKESIRRIVLPLDIVRIGSNAFANVRLTSTLIIPESVKTIEEWAFSSIGDDAVIEMPSSLEYIGGMAFYGLGATMELKLSNTIKHIGPWAFFCAIGATGTFNVPTQLEYIGEHAFEGCGHDLVGDIIIPGGIKEIPSNAFTAMGFSNGTNLTIPEGVTKIGSGAFGNLFAVTKFNSPIIIPESVKIIDNMAFRLCSFAGGNVKIPNSVEYIGRGAFSFTNLGGELMFPSSPESVLGGDGDNGGAFGGTKISRLTLGDNILQIESNGFACMEELEYVEIGRNVGYIGTYAFSNLPKLSTMICLAAEPPTAFDSTFDGIYFDKVVLEVPENSVELYRNADGWKKFQNITAHHELAFNISNISCLDKGISRQGIIRSEGAWSVVECPSWVHVSPDHADHKEELTITVDPMRSGSDTREGNIVFKLNGKEYTTYTSVRQLSYEYAEDTEIVLQHASAKGKEIPVFIVGEGFNADDIVSGEYMRRMEETAAHLFSIVPYKTYKDYFTVTTAVTASPDQGTGNVYDVKTNCFETDGVTPNVDILKSYVERVSEHAGKNIDNALIIMVSNYNNFTGWSEIDWNGCSMAGIGCVDDVYPYDQRGLVQHYAGGEAFAGLGNEMVSHFEHIKGCTCPGCNDMIKYISMKARGYYENLTMSSKMNDAPWRDFVFHPKYSQMVDMWEGGYNHLRGVWRSEANSVMNTYIAYYNTISRYTIYKEIMRRAGLSASLDDFIANDKIELPQ